MTNLNTFHQLKEKIYNIIPVGYGHIKILIESDYEFYLEIGKRIHTIYSDMGYTVVGNGNRPKVTYDQDWDKLFANIEYWINVEKNIADGKKKAEEKKREMSVLGIILDKIPEYVALKNEVQKSLQYDNTYVEHFMPEEYDHEDYKDDDGKIRINRIHRTPEQQEEEGIEALLDDGTGYFSEFITDHHSEKVVEFMRFLIKDIINV